MSENDPPTPKSEPTGSAPTGPAPARVRPLVAAVVGAGVLALAIVLYVVLAGGARGLYGQLKVDGEPAAGVTVALKVVPGEGEVQSVSPTTDADGFFTIPLAPGAYRLESTLAKKQFVRVGDEELEVILSRKDHPLRALYTVGEELVPIPALEVAHPGEVLGPLDGEEVSPTAQLRWRPYPNATRYMIQLSFFPVPSKSAVGSIFLPPEISAWGFSFIDEVGRPTELAALRQLSPEHPEAAFAPGAHYSWRLTVFEGNNIVKATEGPFRFSVQGDAAAREMAASSQRGKPGEVPQSKGALTGLVTEGKDVVKKASFHVTLERQVPATGRRETLSDVPVLTDDNGRYNLEVPPGIYRFMTADVRHGDTLYERVGRQEVVLVAPVSRSAVFDVQPGQYAQVPDIQLNRRFKIIFPTPGATVSTHPTISWEVYPEANRYQLTLTYIGEEDRPSNIYVKLVSTESVSLNDMSVSESFAKKYGHPINGLKPGARYRINVIAYKEPKRQREWDLTQPPPPWIRLSESEVVNFRAEP